jgi:hypothetical protein
VLRLLAVVVPLALGAAITPTIVAVQLVTLTGRARPRARAWALAAGCCAVLLGVSALALTFAASTGGADSPSEAGGIVKLVAAALLTVLGVRAVRRRDKAADPSRHAADPRPRLGRAFAIGCGLMATNFSSLILYFPAMHEIGTSDASTAARVVAFLLLFAITLLPAFGPPLVVTMLGERAQRPLAAMSRFFERHRPAIAAGLCFTFAVLLAAAGIRDLS